MEWKKSKLTRWQACGFTITEHPDRPRPYLLDGPACEGQPFETLAEAKAQAAVLNELALHKEYVAQLRAELAEARGQWPPPMEDDDGAAARRFESIPIGARDEDDDGRGIPRQTVSAAAADSDEARAASAELVRAMGRRA